MNKHEPHKVSRRQMLKGGAALVAGGALLPGRPAWSKPEPWMDERRQNRKILAQASDPTMPQFELLKRFPDYANIAPVATERRSKVIALRDPRVVSSAYVVDDRRAYELLHAALLEFTGEAELGPAVRSLFPSFSKDIRVSIKFNGASNTMPAHLPLARAMADALISAGLKPDNIIVWERTDNNLPDCNYPLVDSKGEVKFIGTNHPGYGYDESAELDIHGVPAPLTSILSRHSDFQINLAVLKHHWFSAIATTLKNHYGSIPLLDNLPLIGVVDIIRLHTNAGDPYIPALNQEIEKRVPTVLHICDALLGAYNNGPLGPPQFVANEIWLSQDPVAIDTIALHKVEQKRLEAGLPSLLHRASFLRTAAKLGLGTNDPSSMDITMRTL